MYIARVSLCIRYVTGSFGGFGLDREHVRVTVVKPVHGIAIYLSCIYEVECHYFYYICVLYCRQFDMYFPDTICQSILLSIPHLLQILSQW